MSWLDIGIITALAVAAIIGLVKGLIKMFFIIAWLVIGILLTQVYHSLEKTSLFPFVCHRPL